MRHNDSTHWDDYVPETDEDMDAMLDDSCAADEPPAPLSPEERSRWDAMKRQQVQVDKATVVTLSVEETGICLEPDEDGRYEADGLVTWSGRRWSVVKTFARLSDYPLSPGPWTLAHAYDEDEWEVAR